MRIAISGAGVAGAALTHWLHRTGHIPTLIEQAPKFRTGGYMIDFWGVGYRVVRRMGIEAQILDAGYEVRCVRSVGPGGESKAELAVDVFRRMIGDDFTSLPRGDLAARHLVGEFRLSLHFRGDGCDERRRQMVQRDLDGVIAATQRVVHRTPGHTGCLGHRGKIELPGAQPLQGFGVSSQQRGGHRSSNSAAAPRI